MLREVHFFCIRITEFCISGITIKLVETALTFVQNLSIANSNLSWKHSLLFFSLYRNLKLYTRAKTALLIRRYKNITYISLADVPTILISLQVVLMVRICSPRLRYTALKQANGETALRCPGSGQAMQWWSLRVSSDHSLHGHCHPCSPWLILMSKTALLIFRDCDI